MKGKQDELNMPGEALRGKDGASLIGRRECRSNESNTRKAAEEVMRRKHESSRKMEWPCGCT